MKHERLVNEIYWAVEHGDLKEADKLVEDVIGKAYLQGYNDCDCELNSRAAQSASFENDATIAHEKARQDAQSGECPNCGRLLTECNGNCIFSAAQEDKNV